MAARLIARDGASATAGAAAGASTGLGQANGMTLKPIPTTITPSAKL
jgi:hypothetical protein